jgi:hypothetical protein
VFPSRKKPESLVVTTKPITPPSQPGLHRRYGDLLEGRNLFDGEFLQLEQNHGLALFRREDRECPGHPIGPSPLFFRRYTVLADHIERLSIVSFQRKETTPKTTPRSIPVYRKKNGVEPGPEAGLVPEGGKLLVRAYHGLLEEVVTVFTGPAEAPGRGRGLIMKRLQKIDQSLPGFRGFHDSRPSSGGVTAVRFYPH